MLRKLIIGAAIVLPIIGVLVACDDKGPAEKAGKKLDDAGKSISDTINPPGPAEKAGRKVDDTLDTDK